MGQITIEVTGSFKPHTGAIFSAKSRGHAAAVGKAINFLSNVVLPQAIARDHFLHEQGRAPTHGYGGISPDATSQFEPSVTFSPVVEALSELYEKFYSTDHFTQEDIEGELKKLMEAYDVWLG